MKRKLLSRILSFCMVFVFVFSTSGVSVLAETAGEALNTEEEIAVDMSVEAEADTLIRPSALSTAEKEQLKKEHEESEEALNYFEYGISNEYLEVAIKRDNGQFTIGNVIGNPNYTTDDDQKLLFGHPNPWSSETLIKVDDDEFFFCADSVLADDDKDIIHAYMNVASHQIRVEQILEFAKSGSTNMKDMVKISYKVYNLGSSNKSVGIRIMLDTMLANNDFAPFKVAGVGNITTRKSFTGSNIPKTYQVYDDLDNPTTIATGIVYKTDTRKPDTLLLTNWGSVKDSSWNFDHGEGDELGDSAVALYYNPTKIVAGSSISVSTYYGVGIGTTITDSNNGDQIDSNFSLGAGQTAVRVKDLATGDVIENAEVTLESLLSPATETTNRNGYAVFDNANDFRGSCKVTVKKTGYKEKTMTATISLARVISVSLQSEEDNRPQITKVTMDGKNLLSQNIYYAENADGVKATSSNSEKITMQVYADQNDCIYQLVQDGEIIQSNTDGKFTFTIIHKSANGKDYTTPRIDGLSAGKLLYVNCISKDGISSGKVRLGIKVKYPSNSSVDTKTSFTLGSKPTLKLNGDKMNPVEKFFFGNGEVSIGADVFPVEVEVNEEGKVTVRVNKNSEMGKEDFDEKIKEASRRISALKGFGGKSFRFAPAFKFDFGFAGYGEGYLKDGSAIVNVQVMGYIKGSKSWTTQFVLGTFPCYVKTTIEGKLEVSGTANLHNQNGMRFEATSGAIEPTVTGKIELGAGISGIVSAGVEGSGDIKFNNNLVTGYYRLSSTLQAKFKAKALFFEYNKTIKKYTKVWLDSESEKNSAAAEEALFTMQDLYDVNEYQMINRDYLTLSAAGEEALGTASIDEEVLKSGAFTNAMPKLVQTEGGTYYFWLDDNKKRTEANRTALSYSSYNSEDGSWSDPVILNDDSTADFYYDVAVAENKIYVVWQNTNKEITEEEAKTLTVNDVFAKADIQAAVIDTTKTENAVTQLSVTSTEQPDILPKIAAFGTNAVITWYSTSAENLLGSEKEANYTIHQAVLGEGGFGTASSIIAAGMITDLDIGYVNGKPVLAYTVDADRNMETSIDRDIYLYKERTTTQFTDDVDNLVVDSSPMFVEEGDSTVLYWYKDGNLAYCENLTGEPQIIPIDDENSRFSDDFVVLTNVNGTKKKIVWASFSKYAEAVSEDYDMEETKAVYAVDWNGESWSAAYQMEEIGEGNILSLSGILDAEGKETLAYQRLVYTEEYNNAIPVDEYVYDNISKLSASDLCLAKSVPRKEVSLDDVIFDADLIEPGQTATFSLTLTNHGNQTVSKVNVWIGDTVEEVSVDIPVGETVTTDVSYFVPNDLDTVMDLDIRVEVPETHAAEEALRSADKNQKIQIGYTEIGVEEQERTIIDGVEYVVLAVKNNSKITADNVNLKLLADDEEAGQVVFDTFFEMLEGKEEKTVYCPLDALAECSVVYARLTTDTSEDYKENNTAVIATNNEIADTSVTVQISVKSSNEEAGTVSYVLGNETITTEDIQITKSGADISLSAAPKEGYVFAGWEVEAQGENGKTGAFEDRNAKSTSYTMPRNDVIITAKFKLASELVNATAIVDTNINTRETIELLVGDEQTLTPSLTVEGDTAEYIVFESSDNEVITVDKEGLVIAEKPGEATVTATVMKRGEEDTKTELSLVYTFNVKNIALTKLKLPREKEVLSGIGTEYNLGEQLVKSPGNATEIVTWSSSNTEVVTVDDEGNLTTVSGGTARITATAKETEGILAACDIEVVVPIESLALSESSLNLRKNEQKTLTLSYFPENTTEVVNNILWMSNDTNVATVEAAEDGLSAIVTCHSFGTCYITASYDDRVMAGCVINVENPITSVKLDQTSVTMNRFEQKYLELTVLPADHDGYINWYSSDEDVVSVDNERLYAKKPGTAIVTAESNNGIKATCTVTVTNIGAIVGLPDDDSFETVNVSDWSKLESDYTDASTHEYPSNVDKMWVYTVPNAKSMRIHFSERTYLEAGFDYIRILDKDNRAVADYEYTDSALAGKWIDIEGNTVKIWMRTDGSVQEYGFKVDACTITPIDEPPKDPPKEPEKVDISRAQCTVSKQEYTGAAVIPDPVVVVNGTVLRNGVDYTLSYTDNVKIGTATVTVTGIGGYKGSIKCNFDIVFGTVKNFKLAKATTTSVKLTWDKVAGAKGYKVYRYDKKKNVLVKTIKSGSTRSLTIKNLKKATAYKFTIVPYRTSGKKTIDGSKKVLQTATCSTAPTLKVKAGAKKVTLTWKKISGISGYEIQMSMKQKSGFKAIKSVSAKTTKFVQSKLKKGKTYYFRIRTYKTISKVRVYSGFSKTIKVKVK